MLSIVRFHLHVFELDPWFPLRDRFAGGLRHETERVRVDGLEQELPDAATELGAHDALSRRRRQHDADGAVEILGPGRERDRSGVIDAHRERQTAADERRIDDAAIGQTDGGIGVHQLIITAVVPLMMAVPVASTWITEPFTLVAPTASRFSCPCAFTSMLGASMETLAVPLMLMFGAFMLMSPVVVTSISV